MRNFGTKTGLLLFFACLIATALYPPEQSFARPASKRLHALRQPDGSSFSARQWGDEHYHGWETEDGYTVIFDEALKKWTYAAPGPDGCLKSSSIAAGKAAPQGMQKHLRATGACKKMIREKQLRRKGAGAAAPAPVTGTGMLPVILMNFNDTSSTYPASDFEALLFSTGSYSLNDYYKEVSYGKFGVGGQVAGWYTASRGHDYYGMDGADTDVIAEELVKEAVSAADASVDFTQYDSNGDCIVDVIIVVHQGPDQAATGVPSDIWSHQSELDDYATNDLCPKGGWMKIRKYTMQNETDEDKGADGMTTVGVFAHEYGHALDLPDLYDTDDSSMGIGEWSLMAEGTDGMLTREGDRPTHLDPWSKLSLGWIAPQMVSGTLQDQSIAPATAAAPGMYQLLSGSPSSGGEYFLVENRQKEKFDVGLPGAGLLIWHIDDSVNPGDNTDNDKECYPGGPSCASQHYRVALVQADDNWDLEKGNNSGDAGDPFPGSTGNTSFDQNSSPASNLYSGSPSSVSITGIQASGTLVFATLAVSSGSSPSTTTTTTDGVPENGCAFESSLEQEEDLTALRSFRDARLQTPAGLSAVAAYYRHAADVSAMLARDPALRKELQDLAERNMAMVRELADGRSVTMSKAGLAEVIQFLESIKSRGSAQLKNDMSAILAAIADGALLKEAGISIR